MDFAADDGGKRYWGTSLKRTCSPGPPPSSLSNRPRRRSAGPYARDVFRPAVSLQGRARPLNLGLADHGASDAVARAADRLGRIIVSVGMNDEGRAVAVLERGPTVAVVDGDQGGIDFRARASVSMDEEIGEIARVIGAFDKKAMYDRLGGMDMASGALESRITAVRLLVEVHAVPSGRETMSFDPQDHTFRRGRDRDPSQLLTGATIEYARLAIGGSGLRLRKSRGGSEDESGQDASHEHGFLLFQGGRTCNCIFRANQVSVHELCR